MYFAHQKTSERAGKKPFKFNPKINGKKFEIGLRLEDKMGVILKFYHKDGSYLTYFTLKFFNSKA